MLGKTARQFTKPRKTYKDALTPSQSRVMSIFLKELLWASEKAKEAGVKPNVELFMKSWIGLPISAEEKRKQHRTRVEEWRKKRRAMGKEGDIKT